MSKHEGDNFGRIRGFQGERNLEEIDCKETEEAGCIGPDEGECLMMQKVLDTESPNPQETQKEAIFYTKCTIDAEVCS